MSVWKPKHIDRKTFLQNPSPFLNRAQSEPLAIAGEGVVLVPVELYRRFLCRHREVSSARDIPPELHEAIMRTDDIPEEAYALNDLLEHAEPDPRLKKD